MISGLKSKSWAVEEGVWHQTGAASKNKQIPKPKPKTDKFPLTHFYSFATDTASSCVWSRVNMFYSLPNYLRENTIIDCPSNHDRA